MKRCGSWFQRLVVIFGLTILVVCLPVIIQKAPRIVDRVARFTKVVEHVIRWDLNPGLTVAIAEGASTRSLSLIHSTSTKGPLRVSADHPRYFTDDSGRAIFLTGSHTWQNLQDSGSSNPLPAFDYTAYLDFLTENNHNFFRLWAWEQPQWSLDSPNDNFRFSPMPYQRTGAELAADGLPKFDLTQFNQDYFDRLRERVVAAGEHGIYVSVMLFNGWSVAADKGVPGGKNPWQSHPSNRANNINGIDGDLNGDGSGEEVHGLAIPAITAIQEAYTRKVIDTVNDLDNVLYEISNESDGESTEWQYHMINFIKNYELGKPKQHPVGMTSEYPDGDNANLYSSPADWISLNGDVNNPPIADGRKVILADTDHLCGVCGDRQWVWKSFTCGENPIFMDVYDGSFDLILERQLNLLPSNSLSYEPWISLRRNMGYVLTYATRMNLGSMKPLPDLASTGYVLANPASSKAEYLIYAPSGGKVTVDLSPTPGELMVEWFNPDTGTTISGVRITGGRRFSFISPFKADSVLYIKSLA